MCVQEGWEIHRAVTGTQVTWYLEEEGSFPMKGARNLAGRSRLTPARNDYSLTEHVLRPLNECLLSEAQRCDTDAYPLGDGEAMLIPPRTRRGILVSSPPAFGCGSRASPLCTLHVAYCSTCHRGRTALSGISLPHQKPYLSHSTSEIRLKIQQLWTGILSQPPTTYMIVASTWKLPFPPP